MKISSCACFLIFSYVLLEFSTPGSYRSLYRDKEKREFITITFSKPEVLCYLREAFGDTPKLKSPSLESFIRASTAEEGQELRLTGLAVFSKLADACQPLPDAGEAKIQVKKIALISLANETVCPLQGLVTHAQNAGYSVVIVFHGFNSGHFENGTQLQDKPLIPVLYAQHPYLHDDRVCYNASGSYPNIHESDLSAADRTKIDIRVTITQTDLEKMKQYLGRLYYWFLLGPLITLEWLRRRKTFCSMSGGQQVEGGRVPEEITAESELNSAADHQETQKNINKGTGHEQTGGKTQPLLIELNDPHANGSREPRTISRVFRNLFGKLVVSSGYVILIVVALPVGISSGGWSFFRFDQDEIQQETFWDGLIASFHPQLDYSARYPLYLIFDSFVPLWWSSLQIFCFFLYSRFACKSTWTVPTNFSKLIRSQWFSSNMYFLILGVAMPYCSEKFYFTSYFICYNTVCTICNVLFVIILNKQKFVTRYVFFISVCMICAYVESNIVAVFYFMLNSKGSLSNLKLTALRTAAIGLTLNLSFSTCTHIIRKLTKPRESVFEGLGEK